jgi:Na+-translocating ferredoxin:NAD+ oxidoreductase RnfC subunit
MRRIRTRNCPTVFTTPDEEEEEAQQKQEQTQSATRERERERAKQAGVATLARRSGIREFQQRTIIGEEGA